ncbi:LysM peptidoglycan-binding domain-containing protein [Paenibacillus arenosi]|uniref:LysM peptidoglycan-binding domain-containing protein n=1 Tax=Paenibacillus arenosi TaxID=2774142 RepID=A0ABR9B0W2_9BACL|nr:LysM peptidoglycan-binding domain-containing protein [Paenibacillus arenosi]MBD8499968.1 LysM peptidoglycan-binding domain-containing protein [Paenibacillus arenosi]
MGYQMFLKLEDKVLQIPVLPEKLEISSPGHNETVTVLGIGEINKLKRKGLREVSFESFFPAHYEPYVAGFLFERVEAEDSGEQVKQTKQASSIKPVYTDKTLPEPIRCIRTIQLFREVNRPIQFLLTGTDLDINIKMGIEELSYDERAGEVGDIYYRLKLKEWRPYSAKTLGLTKDNKARAGAAKRPGSPSASKTHTVVRGESLWAICKKRYDDGGKYPQLYAKNKALMDKRNKGTGLPKYTIYPGQVLVL